MCGTTLLPSSRLLLLIEENSYRPVGFINIHTNRHTLGQVCGKTRHKPGEENEECH